MKRCPDLAGENASVPCSVYFLAMVPQRPSDSGRQLEPRWCWVIGFASRGNEVGPQGLLNLLNNFQLRKVGYRLNMSLQTIDQVFRFLGVREDVNLRLTRGGDRVGTLITRLVVLHSD
jgi:hypothetical protein